MGMGPCNLARECYALYVAVTQMSDVSVLPLLAASLLAAAATVDWVSMRVHLAGPCEVNMHPGFWNFLKLGCNAVTELRCGRGTLGR